MPADIFEIATHEFIKLEDEQIKRIGFRDNLLYVNLVLISGIMSFVFSSSGTKDTWHFYGLLLAAWVTIVLGWTYLVNDEKISSIGRYLRENLAHILNSDSSIKIFGWEEFHRSDKHRIRRKFEQLLIDQLSFVVIGFAAVILFWNFVPSYSFWSMAISIFEAALLIGLSLEIIIYADLKRDRVGEPMK